MKLTRRLSFALIVVMTATTGVATARGLFDQIIKHIHKEVTRPFNTINQVVEDPINAPLNIPMSDLNTACGSPVEDYVATLEGEANRKGRWQFLPPHLARAIQPYYRNNLNEVRVAQGIHTSNNEAQTYGNSIYFPAFLNLYNAYDMHWLLHELEHTSQYAGRPVANGICNYLGQWVKAGFQYSQIDWEQKADLKADQVLQVALDAMNGTYQKTGSIGSPTSASATPTWGEPQQWNQPSRPAPNELHFENRTNDVILFRLQSETKDWYVFRLYPRSNMTVSSDDPTNSWFNIDVRYGDPENKLSVDGGSIISIDGGWRGYVYTAR
jgi:hypothetical protein